ARIGRDREAGPGPEAVAAPLPGRQPRDGVGGPGVLPDDRIRDRSAGPPIPHDGRLALVADADRGQRAGIGPGLAQGDLHTGPDPFEDLVRVVLDHPGRGVIWACSSWWLATIRPPRSNRMQR